MLCLVARFFVVVVGFLVLMCLVLVAADSSKGWGALRTLVSGGAFRLAVGVCGLHVRLAVQQHYQTVKGAIGRGQGPCNDFCTPAFAIGGKSKPQG